MAILPELSAHIRLGFLCACAFLSPADRGRCRSGRCAPPPIRRAKKKKKAEEDGEEEEEETSAVD